MLIILRLFMSAGLPKMPFLGVPIVAFLILIDLRSTLTVLKSKVVLKYYAYVFLCFTFFIFRTFFASGSAADIFLIVALCLKFILGPFIGYYIAKAYHSNLLKYFIPIQVIFLVASLLSSDFYDFLLLFQTSSAVSVFSEIKDLRGLAFGLLHNEGAVFVASIFLLQFYKRGRRYSLFDILSYAFSAMSRLTALLLLMINVMTRPIISTAAVGVLFCVTYLFRDYFPVILNQVFEPIIYFWEHGEFFMASVQHLIWMISFPDSQFTWYFGDGLFFSNRRFYMETDIGVLRLIFFGGLFALC